MSNNNFIPEHINATSEDFQGNNGLGRFVFLPGSDSRAAQIAEFFEQKTVKTHPRHHNLYLGKIKADDGSMIEVAALSSGMGPSSIEIIVYELIRLGACRFLRVGTTGSLQPDVIKGGDIIFASSAVRDEQASSDYIYPEFPAVATNDLLNAARTVGQQQTQRRLFAGVVHTKSSLYGRQLQQGLLNDNQEYMNVLKRAHVLASEMEVSVLYILAHLLLTRVTPINAALPFSCGAILAVIRDHEMQDKAGQQLTINHSVDVALAIAKQWYKAAI